MVKFQIVGEKAGKDKIMKGISYPKCTNESHIVVIQARSIIMTNPSTTPLRSLLWSSRKLIHILDNNSIQCFPAPLTYGIPHGLQSDVPQITVFLA